MEDSGIMSQYRTDPNSPLEQLRKKVEPPTPNSLNAQIEALSDKKREQLNMLVSQLKLSMELSRVRDPYTDYASLIKEMYPRLDIDFAQLITAVMERLDPTPEMPPEVRYKRSSEKKRTPREAAASIYDNPKFFPPRDTMKAEQVYRASVTQFEPTIPTLPKTDDTTFGFDIAAFNTFKDTLGQIESANDYSVRGGFNDHYLGRWQMGKAALEDVGIGYSQEEQEDFLSNPDKQEKAFEEFTKQNHEYLQRKSEKYRDLTMSDKLAVLGYAHNQGRGGALKYLETGESEKDGFGTDALKYVEEVKNALG